MASLVGDFPSKTVKWLHYDRLGNVMNKSGSAGTLTDTYHQDAYGNVLSNVNTGQWASISSFSGRHLTSNEYDAGAAMYYFFQRWYHPQIGRFTSIDPLQAAYPLKDSDFPGSSHPYWYADNNPVNIVDVDGRISRPAAEYCLKKAKKQPNPPNETGACGYNAEVDCKQAKECLAKLGIKYHRRPCGYAIGEIGIGEICGINLCVHAYCTIDCTGRAKHPR